MTKIYCIGDSHISFFSGVDRIYPIWPKDGKRKLKNLLIYHIGPATAHNLTNKNSATKSNESITKITRNIPFNSTIILSFGEIDCRNGIPKIHLEKGSSINELVNSTIDNYLSVIDTLSKNYHIIIWGAIPSRAEHGFSKRYPHIGSQLQRNQITLQFNSCLKHKVRKNSRISFVNIFSYLVNDDLTTKEEYFWDETHLSQKAMPFAKKEFKQIGIII